MKFFDNLPFNWFDIVLVVWLVMGVFRGRKRGMSAEVMTFLQWVAIVIVCGVAYEPAGKWFSETSGFGLLVCYVLAYLVIAGLVALVFIFIKRSIGGKLIGSDAFGKAEYYLGMPTGMLRFACIMIFFLALLNARFYSQKEIEAYDKFQKDVYGSDYFPGLQVLQSSVFEKSLVGPQIKKNLEFLLIKPTPPKGGKEFKQKEWQAPT
jgi:uncharacterized membrane protein required for colicin V production